jgi:hypothetical protein
MLMPNLGQQRSPGLVSSGPRRSICQSVVGHRHLAHRILRHFGRSVYIYKQQYIRLQSRLQSRYDGYRRGRTLHLYSTSFVIMVADTFGMKLKCEQLDIRCNDLSILAFKFTEIALVSQLTELRERQAVRNSEFRSVTGSTISTVSPVSRSCRHPQVSAVVISSASEFRMEFWCAILSRICAKFVVADAVEETKAVIVPNPHRWLFRK